MTPKRRLVGITLVLPLVLASCSPSANSTANPGGGAEGTPNSLKGSVEIDGSSTVAPINNAIEEMFHAEQPGVRVAVGISGTGGGFKKFLDEKESLRTDINAASRPISESELKMAQDHGVEFVEVPIALDGLALLVNPQNTFCDHLTVEELKRIWEPGSKISNWKDVREGFPDLPIKLYGAGADSGTFDYFTLAIMGEEKVCRSDFTGSENDNMLVHGVEGDKGALGYFGFAYYHAHMATLKLLAVDAGDGPVKPSLETIKSGAYHPLSRPLFLYVNTAALKRPEMAAFVSFYLKHALTVVAHPKIGYVPLSEELYNLGQQRVANRITGTIFAGHGAGPAGDLLTLYRGK